MLVHMTRLQMMQHTRVTQAKEKERYILQALLQTGKDPKGSIRVILKPNQSVFTAKEKAPQNLRHICK